MAHRLVRLISLLAVVLSVGQAKPAWSQTTLRVATFNIQELNLEKVSRVDAEGRGTHPQLRAAAAIIQQVRPDILLLNEIDYWGPVDAVGPTPADKDVVAWFQSRYLAHPQESGEPWTFPHRFVHPSNTGVPSGLDLNNDGDSTGPNDALGYGRYPGEYAMALLSRYPIAADQARTFRKLLWREMPHRLMPDGLDGRPAFYTSASAAVFRLSSKSHWDVPVRIDERTLRLLCSHPTPPVFDGPLDEHGRRNHDELRFWADYLTGDDAAAWIRDDGGEHGGNVGDAPFVMLGDLNSDPVKSDATYGRRPIAWVLEHPRVFDPRPRSAGAEAERNPDNLTDFLPFKTSRFGRLDYVLPSRELTVSGQGVFWPVAGEPLHQEARQASDHRLVWVDLAWP